MAEYGRNYYGGPDKARHGKHEALDPLEQVQNSSRWTPPGAQVGDVFPCPNCGGSIITTTGSSHECSSGVSVPSIFTNPPVSPEVALEQRGWVCPVCGRGVAPFMPYCPFEGQQKVSTTTTTTSGEAKGLDMEKSVGVKPLDRYCGTFTTDCGYDSFLCPNKLDAQGRCSKHGERL